MIGVEGLVSLLDEREMLLLAADKRAQTAWRGWLHVSRFRPSDRGYRLRGRDHRIGRRERRMLRDLAELLQVDEIVYSERRSKHRVDFAVSLSQILVSILNIG